MENTGVHQQLSPEHATASRGLAESLRAVLPDFGEAELVAQAEGCVQFRATHSSGQAYSVFIAPEQLGGYTDADRQGFFQDAKLAMGVEHRNLVRALHVTRIPGHYAVITELAEGPTLGQLVRENKIDKQTAVSFLNPLVDAVKTLHEAGVVHRAINPDSVIVLKDGTLRLVGAGFANLLFPLWQKRNEETELRLQPFMAPECGVKGLSGSGVGADVFSLGIIHYLLLTGDVPKGSFFALPSQKAKVEAFIDSAVSRAIQSKPEQRHQNMPELIEELSGLRPKEIVHQSTKEESKSAVKKFRGEDGMLSWLTWKRLCGAFIFMLLLGSGAAYIVWEKEQFKEAMKDADIDAILARLSEAEDDLSAGRIAAALTKLTDVASNAEVSREVLRKMMGMLVDAGLYEEALEIGERYAGRADEGMPDYDEFMGLFASTKGEINDFIEVRELASLARADSNSALEYDMLLRAKKIMPKDKDIHVLLMENPYHMRKMIAGAMRELKAKNPRQKEWKYHASVRRGFAKLNLSGNAYLTDISALAGVSLQALDLADTGVANILPLSEMPLVELRLDRCPVQALEPLSNAKLRFLSLNGVGVPYPKKEWYTSIPHRPGDTTSNRKAPASSITWENSMGMPFAPLPSVTHAVMAAREVSFAEFDKYLERRSLMKKSRSLLVYREAEKQWQRIETDDWKKPGFDVDGEHPVVGVNISDCEAFCKWLTEKERRAGILTPKQYYRLPSDFEWSLAAGLQENPLVGAAARMVSSLEAEPLHQESALVLSEGYQSEIDSDRLAKSGGNWIRPVASAMSADGFFDLGGNAREWCRDSVDGTGNVRIIRGGSAELGHGSRKLRTEAHRLARFGDVGFRIVLEIHPPKDESRLVSLIVKNEIGKARDLASRQSLKASHSAKRAAGQSALKVLDFISRPKMIDDSPEIKNFGKSRYYLANLPADWNQASAIAKAAGGHLVTVTSGEEAEWIERHYFTAVDNVPALWLGASNGAGGDRWTWTTAERWEHMPKEVPPAQKDSENPEYNESALVYAPGEALADGHAAVWKKRPCTELHSFLIEWDEQVKTVVRSKQAIRPGQKRELAQVPGEE